MDEPRHNLQETLRSTLADSPASAEHPTPDELMNYHSKALASADASRIEEHLLGCRECSELLLDLVRFPELDANNSHTISNSELNTAWEKTRGKLGFTADQARPNNVIDFTQHRRTASSKRAWLFYAAAAVLLLALLPPGVWIVELRRENRELAARLEQSSRQNRELNDHLAERNREVESVRQALTQAEQNLAQNKTTAPAQSSNENSVPTDSPAIDSQVVINVPIIELYPDERLRSDSDAAKSINLPRQINLFTVTLNIADGEPSANYKLEIVDRKGQQLWSGSGLQKTAENNFSVALPRRLFSSGVYRLKLYRQGNSSPNNPVAVYTVRLQGQ